ncbi:MAG: nucleoside monophosphate kinase [Candidatus Paceibacterota bacterium]|jgi:adenylate kinase family enzyme
MELQTVIFIGRSGSGKGTQSEMIKNYIRERSPGTPILYFETGDHFRQHINDTGHTWDLARKINDEGGRQPDFLAVWIWSHMFIERLHGNEHIIFDGAPRALEEAKILDTAFSFYKRNNPAIIFINVSEKWAEDHLRGRGRADDLNPEVIARRLAFFTKDVVPTIEYYRTASGYRFCEINGEQTPDEVFNDVIKCLKISNS